MVVCRLVIRVDESNCYFEAVVLVIYEYLRKLLLSRDVNVFDRLADVVEFVALLSAIVQGRIYADTLGMLPGPPPVQRYNFWTF